MVCFQGSEYQGRILYWTWHRLRNRYGRQSETERDQLYSLGAISLIEDGTVVFSVVTQSALYEKTISNMVEVKSRGAKLFGLTTYGNYNMEDVADFTVYIPKIDNLFAGSLAVIPLQLLSYYVSVGKGFDVDKPRNLAKSVTVE